jgi:hypothetical protein
MERISSGTTFFMKWVFPVFWLGFLVLWLITAITMSSGQVLKTPAFLIVPLGMAIFGAFLFRKILWDLADEVRDGGTFLIVRKGGVEERIPLEQIINVSVQQYMNPNRLTLRLRKAGKFGDEVSFIPKVHFRLNPFARHPLADSLITRIDRTRQQHV